MDQTWRPFRRQILAGLGLGAVLTIPAILAAIMSGGAGHGSYIAARLLFPYSMLLMIGEGAIGPVGIVAGLLQFPFYGALVGRALAGKDYRVVACVAAAHGAAAIACFSGLWDALR